MHTLVRLWTKLGERMNQGMTWLLFALCYLLIVPIFAGMRFLLVRSWMFKSRTDNTFWLDKRSRTIDMDFFKRMG